MKRRLRSVIAVFLVIGSGLLAGQVTRPGDVQSPPTPTFKAEVEYVEVDALVTDEQGRFVRGLQREDFRIFEEGRPQTIATFALVDIPVERTPPRLIDGAVIEPDVQSTDSAFTGGCTC